MPSPAHIQTERETLTFASFLAPALYTTYEAIARFIGEQLDYETTLTSGQPFEGFAAAHCTPASSAACSMCA